MKSQRICFLLCRAAAYFMKTQTFTVQQQFFYSPARVGKYKFRHLFVHALPVHIIYVFSSPKKCFNHSSADEILWFPITNVMKQWPTFSFMEHSKSFNIQRIVIPQKYKSWWEQHSHWRVLIWFNNFAWTFWAVWVRWCTLASLIIQVWNPW